MTKFKDTFVGKEWGNFTNFVGGLWLKLEPTVETAAVAAGHDAGKIAASVTVAAFEAGQKAHDAGGGYGDVRDAVIQAAGDSAKTVGVTVGIEELGTLATTVEHAITAPATPPPPAE